MTLTLPGVLSQRAYPGVGDLDECWMIATVWSAHSAQGLRHPSVYEFRAAAGNPDRVGATGGNVDDLARAIPVVWPTARWSKIKTTDWNVLRRALDRGDFISIAVLSSKLPTALQFGFKGNHQLGIVQRGGRIYAANPLAPQGSQPIVITEGQLHYATAAVANGWVLAAAFHVPHWTVKVRPLYRFFRYLPDGSRVRKISLRGFSGQCEAPALTPTDSGPRSLVRVTTGAYEGWYLDRDNNPPVTVSKVEL